MTLVDMHVMYICTNDRPNPHYNMNPYITYSSKQKSCHLTIIITLRIIWTNPIPKIYSLPLSLSRNSPHISTFEYISGIVDHIEG